MRAVFESINISRDCLLSYIELLSLAASHNYLIVRFYFMNTSIFNNTFNVSNTTK